MEPGGWYLLPFTDCIWFLDGWILCCWSQVSDKVIGRKKVLLSASLQKTNTEIEGGQFLLSNIFIVCRDRTNGGRLCYLLTRSVLSSDRRVTTSPSSGPTCKIWIYSGFYWISLVDWVSSWLPYFHEYQVLFYFLKLKICSFKI